MIWDKVMVQNSPYVFVLELQNSFYVKVILLSFPSVCLSRMLWRLLVIATLFLVFDLLLMLQSTWCFLNYIRKGCYTNRICDADLRFSASVVWWCRHSLSGSFWCEKKKKSLQFWGSSDSQLLLRYRII